MANTSLFRSFIGALLPRATTQNFEGAPAYARPPRQALAQYAATGCLNTTFYAGAGEQLDRVLDLCGQVTPEFIARTAVYARTHGQMKDMPALLLAALSRRDRGADGSRLRSRRRFAAAAPHVRADRAVWSHRPEVAGVGAEALCAALAGPAQ